MLHEMYFKPKIVLFKHALFVLKIKKKIWKKEKKESFFVLLTCQGMK